MLKFISIILLLVGTLCVASVNAQSKQAHADIALQIFAAASLKEALDEAANQFEKDTNIKTRIAYAASSTLARQIQAGAPVDIFFSADEAWMDYLQKNHAIRTSSRHALLHNQLVLITATANPVKPFTLSTTTRLSRYLPKNGRMAVATIQSVPAGKYAKASLQNLGLWNDVAPRIVETENVRACLLLVARGEATLGITYKTDALIEPRTKVLATFPDTSHPPIIYPVAATASAKHQQASRFLDWLKTPQALSIFRKYGFGTVTD